MAFNTSYSAEQRFLVNPKDLRFTQPDIKSIFTDPTCPTVRQTASLLRAGQFSPHGFGDLHVSIDEQGNMWCDNNRRLFVFREAGVDSVPVVFYGTRRPINSLKGKLSDPDFMPRIRGEASRVQIPPPPTSGRNAYQLQMNPSLPGSASSGYWNRQPYSSHKDEDEDELGAMFSQLAIKSTSTVPTYSTHRESASSKQWGEVNPDVFNQPHIISNFDPNGFGNPNCRLYVHKEVEDDSVPISCNGNWRGKNAVENKPNYPASMPRISGVASGVRVPLPATSGWNGYQMEMGSSVLGSGSAGYSKRQLNNSHEDNEVHYKYQCPVPYGEEGRVGHEYQVFCEAKDDEKYGCGYPFPYEDEGEYEYPVPCEANGYPFPYEDEGKYEYPVPCEANGYPFQHQEEREVDYHSIPTVFCEDDFKYSVPNEVEDGAAYIHTVFSEDDFMYRYSPYHYD